MRWHRVLYTAVAGALMGSVVSCQSIPARPRHAIEQEKLRVLVDKVLMKSNRWIMTEQHVREIRDAGFNVVSPRLGGDDMDRVRKVAGWAGKYGIYYMAWMRGSLGAKQGLKYVHADGRDQPIYSPNADELWEWMGNLILEHANLSLEVPALVGSFLDFENYAPGKTGDCYGLSYDERILREFAASEGIQLPALQPEERYPWLVENKLHDRFERFQIASWRQRCRDLRARIDAINPAYLLIIYPAPGTLFMTEAAFPTWGTAQAPLVLADASTYGRSAQFMAEREALEDNRRKLLRSRKSVRKRKIPHIYIGGIDPVVGGADPEFCGKNAAMIADVTDGYWVFYEGPRYDQDHRDYFDWFKRANDDIAAGTFALQRLPRSRPENLGEVILDRKTDKPQIGVYSGRRRIRDDIEKAGVFEVHELRGVSLAYLLQYDVVLLQNFNLELPADHLISKNLREFVARGGGLMLGHDTAWFMESIFPEIAVRGYPKNMVEAERHVVDSTLVVDRQHPALPGMSPEQSFKTEFRDHMIFKPGKQGTVLIRNRFGDPVYVAGIHGKGRVIYSGCYYGYANDLRDGERQALMGMLDWLRKADE